MLRPRENTDSWKAGALAIAVHVFLLGAMLVSFNWKAAHPVMSVTEVELWDKLPSAKPVIQEQPKPEPKPIVEEKPEIKPEPKPEPKPVVEEKPKPEEPKVDIELEKKKEELKQKEIEQKQKALDEKRKKDVLEKIQEDARKDELREKKALEKKATEKQQDALKKMQQDMLSEEHATENKQANAASAAANASVIGEYTDKIKSKIRGNVNKTLCGDGNPELRFTIGLLPTGELSGTPRLTKSSGNSACDDAVERAIAASQPLPLPSDPAIYAKFRNLNLTFKPNE
ncbi:MULTISPECIES: cell envelope integrity protein TolA [Methylotenera]|uniref:cell envelope integrity protein TolA n=1 Tax=Methylotenera TaxID=359407 RepID=UPI00036853AE|nr:MULTISPECIES: cell envelope integrity protein TolA [Methylotenera]